MSILNSNQALGTSSLRGSNPDYKGKAYSLFMLIRREIWCHKSIYTLPLILLAGTFVIAALTLAVPGRINGLQNGETSIVSVMDGVHIEIGGDQAEAVFADADSSGETFRLDLDGEGNLKHLEMGTPSTRNLLTLFGEMPELVREKILAVGLLGYAKFILMIMGFVLALLATKSLIQEEKDQSVFFWKSMPVSDGMEILARILFLLVLMPLIMWLTVIAGSILIFLVYSLAALIFGLSPGLLFWSSAPLFEFWGILGQQLVHDILWFVPMVAWVFVLHAWNPKRRNWILIPPVVAVVVDKIWFGGGHVWGYLVRHGIPPGIEFRGPLMDEYSGGRLNESWATGTPFDLWSGVLIGVALFCLAAWLRRIRDER
jgi:hypothetical protein